ncbi:MAG: hypothetical protein ACXWLH_05430, partial [Candidatus Saccharimonadales bacterium]
VLPLRVSLLLPQRVQVWVSVIMLPILRKTVKLQPLPNFVVNLMAGITAYCLSDNKPTLFLTKVNLLHSA